MDYKNIMDYAKEMAMESGREEGVINTAIMMIKEFNLSLEEVSIKLNISINELEKYLKR